MANDKTLKILQYVYAQNNINSSSEYQAWCNRKDFISL